MNTSLFDRRRAERFAQLLDEANGGRRHHTRSRVDDQLTELVAVGQQLQTVTLPGTPDASFKRDLRAQLIATAQREGIGVTARPETEDRRSTAGWPARTTGRARARGAIVVGIAAGTLALSGVSVASGDAMPGDTLYGVKRSTEKAQLALAGSDLSRGRLYLEFARTRLQEAHAVRRATGFVDALRDMDGDTRQGIKMLLTSAIERRDTGSLDAVDRFVTDQRMLVAQLLDDATGAGRDKVTDSLRLLDQIEQRSADARTAMACGAASVGSDKLGAVPGTCANVSTQPQQPSRQEQPQQPVEENKGKPAGNGPNPSTSPAPSASASPAPTGEQTPAPQEEGLLDELGRILGGLLG
ncbi:DUF5667 domain-containing protein [Catellatospora sp. KI3]|nr:DUF5667 domain-containing protein [Catellatospora sp. KI3]MDI1460136.1 DUF5667 domain-containing protein [Catellatospora sp. KI3]